MSGIRRGYGGRGVRGGRVYVFGHSLFVAGRGRRRAAPCQRLLRRGAGKTAKKFRNYAYVTALVTALVYFLALLFCRELIPKAFGTSDEAGALAARVLPIFGAGTLFTAIIKVTSSYFYSIGKSKVSYGLVYGELVIVFAAAFALSSFLKLEGVWLALPLTQAVLCVAAVAILFALSRKNKFKNI